VHPDFMLAGAIDAKAVDQCGNIGASPERPFTLLMLASVARLTKTYCVPIIGLLTHACPASQANMRNLNRGNRMADRTSMTTDVVAVRL